MRKNAKIHIRITDKQRMGVQRRFTQYDMQCYIVQISKKRLVQHKLFTMTSLCRLLHCTG